MGLNLKLQSCERVGRVRHCSNHPMENLAKWLTIALFAQLVRETFLFTECISFGKMHIRIEKKRIIGSA